MTRFEFVQSEKAIHPVAGLCHALGVSPSGYWAWRHRGPSTRREEDKQLTEEIRRIHKKSDQTYGAPRVHAELIATGVRCGRKRVGRLMKAAGLVGCHRRRSFGMTRRDPLNPPAPDRVSRLFQSMLPNRLWVADITHVPTREGFLYLAVVIDVFSRRVVGWSMSERIDTQLVISALDMAVRMRKPGPGVIHHSDQGRQYTSIAFGTHCQTANIVPSMGSVGSCYDNAMAESFFATLECELLRRHRFHTRSEARGAIFHYIEIFYNRRRRHSALGYNSPDDFERKHASTPNPQLSIVHQTG